MPARLTHACAVLFIAALPGLGSCYATVEEQPSGPNRLRPAPDAAAPAAKPRPPRASDGSPRARAKPKPKKKPAQSYREAWRIICHAERLSGADPAADPMTRSSTVASWLVDNLRNIEARYWFLTYGKLKKEEQPATFRAEARRAGFSSCPLERLLFAPLPAPAPSPGGRDGGGGAGR